MRNLRSEQNEDNRANAKKRIEVFHAQTLARKTSLVKTKIL